MASKRFEKGSCEWVAFNEFWRICQEFWEPEDNEQYWDEFNRQISGFMKRHKDFPMANTLAIGLNDFLDLKFRIGKGIQ